MPILSRRTVAALPALCCLLAAPGFAVPAHAAGDNSNVIGANLREGDWSSSSVMARLSRIKRIRILSTSITSRPSETSMTRAEPWQKFSATPSSGRGSVAKASPASTTEPTKLRSSLVSRRLRRRQITEGGLVVSPNENSRRIDALRRLLATAPMPVPRRF